jgi:hypothetical protein
MKPIAVDFETSWTKDRSIGTHGTFNYLSHPETKIFMVAIYGDGVSYVGEPEDAPWDEVRGNLVIAHNYTFEHAVFRECERRGIIKEPLNETGFCTADMSAYLQAPRNLLGAARELLGVSLDKTTRDKFKGKDFDTLPIDIQLEISNYALMDAKACFHLYKRYHHLWPEHEQKLSDHTRLMGRRGINLDIERLEQGIRHYKEVLWGLEKLIPWSGEEKLLSPIALKNACRKAGIPAPESTAKNDESFQVWADEYSSKVPFVAAVSKYRSVNRSLEVLEAMKIRLVGERMQYGMKYCGAIPTFRWAGDSGLNMQNLPRNEVEGINIRHMLVPAPGKKFISADMSQIEPRVSLYLTGDKYQLEQIRNGMCVYEAHGRQTLGYDLPISMKEAAKTDEKYNDLRQFCKARCLSADTLILTSRGYLPIVQVQSTDSLWDGLEWVSHDGVVCNGEQETELFYGDQYTPDHELFINNQECISARRAITGESSRVERFRASASSWNDVWFLASYLLQSYSQRKRGLEDPVSMHSLQRPRGGRGSSESGKGFFRKLFSVFRSTPSSKEKLEEVG